MRPSRVALKPGVMITATLWSLTIVASVPAQEADSATETLTAAEVEFFESKVRPILVEHCYECHSAEADFAEASLLLDSKAGWQHGGDSGPAIKPGDVDGSLLVEAIRYEEDIVSGMPPRSKLPDDQIKILEEWIKLGAPDPRHADTVRGAGNIESFDLQQRFSQHWSWRPIARPEPPPVQQSDWPTGPIDHFVLNKLEDAGLAPAGDADKEIWLRRVYFDLIGLPPTVEQIDAFLADDEADTHARVVDQLLRSSHFGEKWARHWMDLVRYAETYGHEFDYPIRNAHEYRDYLIRAFNADVPYDQFVTEHIAGDLLEQPRRHPQHQYNESILGTAFWYLHEATHAPTDVLGNEADIIDNQIDVFGKAFLGLTVACARCHDHKFDAISTADYYALSAYLQSSCRQRVRVDVDRRAAIADATIDRLRAEAQQQLKQVDWLRAVKAKPGSYYEAAVRLRKAAAGNTNSKKDWSQIEAGKVTADAVQKASEQRGLDAQLLQQWVAAAPDVGRALAQTPLPSATNADVSVPADESPSADRQLFASFDSGKLPSGWSTTGHAFEAVGSAATLGVDGKLAKSGIVTSHLGGDQQVGILRSPTFEIATNKIHLRIKATPGTTVRLIIDHYAMAEFNALLFKGTFLSGKSIDTGGEWAWKSLGNDLRKYVGHRAYLEIIDEGDGSIQVDSILFSDDAAPQIQHDLPGADHAAYVNSQWLQAISRLRQGLASSLTGTLMQHDLLQLHQLSPAAAERIGEAAATSASIPAPRYALAMAQGTAENAHIYIRGSHANLGQQVPPRFLEALGATEGDRLTLAREVTSPDNPLTARVIVNRLWHHLFGRGIVPSVDDFGPQGQPPSHPHLLDWLATDFIDHGWSLKHSLRNIVLSRTYRQSSVPAEQLSGQQLAANDPNNQLLHCMPVRRLPAESIRDAILAVSGGLDPAAFGPSVATHRTPFMTGRGAKASGPLDGDGRRSVYLSIYRNFLNPFLLAFDTPSPFGPQGRRSRSNVPAQALTLMNDPFVVQQAERWSKSVRARPDLNDRQRLRWMMRAAHGVSPDDEQLQRLQQFLQQQSTLPGSSSDQAWVDLAHALFNMKAFYFLR